MSESNESTERQTLATQEREDGPAHTAPSHAPEQSPLSQAEGVQAAPGEPRRRRRRRRRRAPGSAEASQEAQPGAGPLPLAEPAGEAEEGEEPSDDAAAGERSEPRPAERAGRAARSERAGRPGRGERSERGERADRGERPERSQAERTEAEPVSEHGGEGSSEREPLQAAAVRDDGAPPDIAPALLDPEGIKILNRLHRYNHQAYFVGGCVRDLLLGRAPKDYDICTSAHPGEVRSLFRNCRLIGRRFRLAHIYFRGGKIIEVSTFRANPLEGVGEEEGDLPDDLLITRDNVFGTAEQDARRRDFTINGLVYDIRLGRVIDYVEGRPDLEARVIRTIGNPEVRLREDPVRILRAVRFAARLGFDLDPATYAAMEGAVEDLPRCAPARLLEETFKLLRGGSSRRSFELLDALGALRILLPPVGKYLRRGTEEERAQFFARLEALDARLKDGPVDDSVIIAALVAPLMRPVAAGEEAGTGGAIDALLDQMVQTARLPRRIADRARQLLWAQGVLAGDNRRRKSAASFRRHPLFPDALALLELETAALGQGGELVERWKSGQPPVAAAPEAEGPEGRRRRRRRGGRGRRRQGEGGDVPPPAA